MQHTRAHKYERNFSLIRWLSSCRTVIDQESFRDCESRAFGLSQSLITWSVMGSEKPPRASADEPFSISPSTTINPPPRSPIFLRAAIERLKSLPTLRQRLQALKFISKVFFDTLWFYATCLPVLPRLVKARVNFMGVGGSNSLVKRNVRYGNDSNLQT